MQHLLGVLAQQGRGAAVLHGRGAQAHRAGDGGHRAQRMRQIDLDAPGLHLRIGKHFVQPVHRAAGHVGLLQGADPFGRGAHDGGLAQQRNQDAAVRNALRVGGKARVLRPLRVPSDLAKARELAIVANGQNHVAVGRGKALVGHDAGVGIAHAARHHAADQVVRGLVGQRGHLYIQQGGVDVLAQARVAALLQCGQDADGGVQAGEDVGQRHAHFLRASAVFTVGHAGDAHQAAHGLNQKVVARPRRVGAVLAKAGNRAVNQARVEGVQAGVIQAVLRQAAGFEVFQHDVGLCGQLLQLLLALGAGHVDGNRALVAVGAQKVGRFARGLAVGTLQIRRAPGAGVVAAAGAFDLDHVGTQVAQDLAGPGAGQHAGKVKHTQTGQGLCAGRGVGHEQVFRLKK